MLYKINLRLITAGKKVQLNLPDKNKKRTAGFQPTVLPHEKHEHKNL
jgi:hypothetical protein